MGPRQRRVVAHVLAASLFLVAAATAHPARAFSGLDSLEAAYVGLSNGWMAAALKIAAGLCASAMVVMFAYRYARTVAQAGGNLKATIPALPSLVAESLIPYWIVAYGAPPLLKNVVAFATNIGLALGMPSPPAGPDDIMTQGVELGWGTVTTVLQQYVGSIETAAAAQPACTGNIIQIAGCTVSHWASLGAQATAMEQNLPIVFFCALSVGLGIMYCFAMLAAEFLMAQVQVYITLPLGAWGLGLTGTPAQGVAGNIWGAVHGAVARFLTIFALITVAMTTAKTMQASLGSSLAPKPPANLTQGLLDVLGFNFDWFVPTVSVFFGMVILIKIIEKAGDLADSVASGRGVLSGAGAVSGFVGSAANAAAGVAIGAATGGAGGAALGAVQGARGAASSGMISMMRK